MRPDWLDDLEEAAGDDDGVYGMADALAAGGY
jgi:hypothetical protein